MAGAHVVRDCRFWLLAFRNSRREEEVGEEGVCIARGGSQSDLHKSVHQFGIDCFPNQQPLDRRHKQTHTYTLTQTVTNSGTQFIWPKFPSGLIFPCCVVQVQLLVVDERRLLSLWFLRPGVSAVVTVTVAPADIAWKREEKGEKSMKLDFRFSCSL